VCDHSQGVYFHPNTGGGVSFSSFESNKQTNKQIGAKELRAIETQERKKDRLDNMIIN